MRPCNDCSAAVSPDSRYVVTQSETGPVEIPLAGGPPTTAPGNGSDIWSPGGRVAYPDFTAARTSADGTIPIVVSDVHGRNPQIAARVPYDANDSDGPGLAWLADGRNLLVSISEECGGDDLYAAAPNGGRTRRLTHDARDLEDPAFSPDGSRVAYTVEPSICGRGDPVHIETVAADGTGRVQVTDDVGDGSGASFDGNPTWSLDGTRIVFSHDTTDGDTSQLESAPSAGGGARTVLTTFTDGRTASALPSGARIAYVQGRSLLELPPGGGAPVALGPALPAGNVTCGYGGGIAWSASGSTLAVARAGGIYTLALGTGAAWKLAIRFPCAGEPAFSPDGTQIAFDAPHRKLELEPDIYAANIDGSHAHVVSSAPFRISRHPTWGT